MARFTGSTGYSGVGHQYLGGCPRLGVPEFHQEVDDIHRKQMRDTALRSVASGFSPVLRGRVVEKATYRI
jgi:hypothetical protein